MLTTILGLPGALTELCRDICLELSRASGRQVASVQVASVHPDIDPQHRDLDALGSLATGLLEATTDHVLAVSSKPDRALCEALRDADRPFLLVIDDPRIVALETIRATQIDATAAARLIGASCACLVDALALPTGVRLTRSELLGDPRRLARTILGMLRLGETADDVSHAAATIGAMQAATPDEQTALADVGRTLRAELPPEGARTVEAALTGYNSAFLGKKLGPVIATRETFYAVEPLGAPLAGEIDATGRARCLAYGPYFSIPSGNWTLRLVFAFSSDLSDIPFTVDIARTRKRSQVQVTRVSFRAVTGRYVTQLPFSHPESDTVLEFRVYLDRPVFEGRVSLGYAELVKNELPLEADLSPTVEWQGEVG